MVEYTHNTVNHGEGEYATPEGVRTNQIESFLGYVKRSIAGANNNVSHKYLERYVKEFEYRDPPILRYCANER